MIKTFFKFSNIIILFLFFGCNKNIDNNFKDEVIYVKDKLVDCQGEMPKKCMLVKKELKDKWELFYDRIEGFNYKPGFIYKIKIRTYKLYDIPADTSSRRYFLIRVINKKEVK